MIVHLDGELDYGSERLARAEIESALDRTQVELVLDLGGLTVLDARGVHVLLDALSTCRAQQRRLLLVPAPHRVQRILALCRVDDRFELLEREEHPPDAVPSRRRASA